ncbi:MAG: response regulator [Gemmatimonadota bacterium]
MTSIPTPPETDLAPLSAMAAEYSLVGMGIVDEHARLLFANQALADLLGCASVAELLDTSLASFHPFPELALDILRDRLREGIIRDAELELTRRDGVQILTRLHARLEWLPTHDGDVRIPCAFFSVEDITGAKDAAKESSHGQKMEAVARFAAGIAHDYNNLLTTIIGEARQLVDETNECDAHLRSAEAILQAAKKAAGITRRLLVFSRSEVSQTKVIDLNGAARAAEPVLHSLLASDIDLIWRLEPDVGSIRIDPNHFDQILAHLTTNARDAMPGGGRMVIETARISAPEDTEGLDFHPAVPAGRFLSLAVGDSGIGMNQETRSRIFDPFFTTKGNGGGAGLGLTTVYGLIRKAGGHISVLTAPAYGTLVRILFPECTEQATDTLRRPSKQEMAPNRTRRILLVDDDESVRRVMAKVLRRAKYEVIEAGDGALAREILLKGEAVDLLITDVMMPRLKGTDLAGWAAERDEHLRILLVSGYTDSPPLQLWVDDDPEVFLPKPFEPNELLARVRKRLG